jgi:hypothetical protein
MVHNSTINYKIKGFPPNQIIEIKLKTFHFLNVLFQAACAALQIPTLTHKNLSMLQDISGFLTISGGNH